MSTNQQTSCELCGFCQWKLNNDDTKIQVGCDVGQLDKYKELRKRVDPNGHEVDNKVLKLTEMDGARCYVINMPCLFQRTQEWINDNCSDLSGGELRQFVFTRIPFDFGLVIMSDGHNRQVLRTCKSVCNGTVPPRWVEIVIPPDKYSVQMIEDLNISISERKGKDITIPTDVDAVNNINYFNVRQLADNFSVHLKDMVFDAIKARSGYFWFLTLQAGTKIDAGFIESIKKQVIDLVLDFQIISLTRNEAMIVQPIFMGSLAFDKSGAFVYRNGNLYQEYNVANITEFFNVVDA